MPVTRTMKNAAYDAEAQSDALTQAYARLLESFRGSVDKWQDSSKHPVSMHNFQEAGVPLEVLLRLIYQAHVEHVQPVLNSDNDELQFEPANSLIFRETSYFVLTDQGKEFADSLVNDPGRFPAPWDMLSQESLHPYYDNEERIFFWGRHVLKQFRQPAINQEIVLCSAQELNWPRWFDDPLPRERGINPKKHLHDTIKDLNRRQKRPFIHFKGDGSGTRIGWEFR